MARDDMAKLEVLLDHWIEHNREHAEEFTEWAEKAKGLGQEAVHEEMTQAVKQMNRANESLLAALKRLKER
jgi:nickel/cobalt exporter